jgi:hypothetical protein
MQAAYLGTHYGSQIRWAVAGRDQAKLTRVLHEIGHPCVPILVADSNDAASLLSFVQNARVVLSTVGPFDRYGKRLEQDLWDDLGPVKGLTSTFRSCFGCQLVLAGCLFAFLVCACNTFFFPCPPSLFFLVCFTLGKT